MDNIQADALRRVKEMQSMGIPRGSDRPFENTNRSKKAEPSPKESHPPTEAEKPKGEKTPSESLSLFADKEKLLILALILLLSGEENSDPSLTLALLYLII